MINLKINNIKIEVEENTPVIDAAEKAGFKIPALCYKKELGHFTSCMLCLVKDKSNGNKLFPSCSVKVTEGMDIITEDEEIFEARKTGLELLLSDHVGDCEAPCQIACPAHMDIPKMNRYIAQGKIDEALKIVRKDIVLPSVLGRICPAPCEGACRRKTIDGPVSICLLKRYAGDLGNIKITQAPLTYNKKVAIIGAGPAGLSAAFYLQQKGIQTIIFDKNQKPGGALRYSIPDEQLDKKILDKEIKLIEKAGVEFRQNENINSKTFKKLLKTYNSVIIATGDFIPDQDDWKLEHNEKQIIINKQTYQTNIENVFAIGNVTRSSKYAIRSLGQGKEVAFSIEQYFKGLEITGEPRLFNSKFGKLVQEEFSEYLKESNTDKRFLPSEGEKNGYTIQEVKKEASRCMHCDCRKIDDCQLRLYSGQYQSVQKRFAYDERKPVKKYFQHEIIVYEPEKCIKCGICVRLTQKYQEEFGFTFIGRGFEVEIGIPFNEEIKKGLTKTALMVAEACPTGALAKK